MPGQTISRQGRKRSLVFFTIFIVSILVVIVQSTTGAASTENQSYNSPVLAAELHLISEYEAPPSDPIPDRGADPLSTETSASVFRCDYPGVTIPDDDSAGTYQGQEVSQSGTLVDLDVYLNVTHPFLRDLKFDLEHVDTGRKVTFYYRPNCSGDDIDATFNDGALSPFPTGCPSSGTPAIQGSFQPFNPLSVFEGENVNGEWRIYAYDLAGSDIGTLNHWCISAALASDVGPIVYDGHVIDDDNSGASSGNNNGVVDCGETIEMAIWVRNQGTFWADLVDANIWGETDPYTTIIEGESLNPRTISGGERAQLYPYVFQVNSNTPDGHVIHFPMYITHEGYGGPWEDSFNVPVSCPTPPPNDDFDNAYIVGSLPYQNEQSTRYSTAAADDPITSCSNDWGRNVWYRFTPSTSGLLRFQTAGSNYDTWLAIFTGSRGNLTEVACNDDHPDIGLDSRIDMVVSAGTTYHLWFGGDDNDFGDLVFEVTELQSTPATPTLHDISNSDNDGDYTVSWSSVAGAESYQLQEQYNGGGWSTIYNGSGSSRSSSGQAGGTWCYRVRASNSGGASGWSATKCTTVDTPPNVPSTPTLNNISNSDQDGNYIVSWTAVTDATIYELQEQLNSGGWITIYNGSGTSKSRSGQADGTWCYRVRASSSNGSSGWSASKCTFVQVETSWLSEVYIPMIRR